LIYPNPVGDAGLNLEVTSIDDKEFDLRVYDDIGKLVHLGTYLAGAGTSTHTISTMDWASGTYFLHLRSEGKSIVKEVIRKR
ncbi:MAG: T9SS type A sorting domain-containing protein, partial [Bacteroidota bacterium]